VPRQVSLEQQIADWPADERKLRPTGREGIGEGSQDRSEMVGQGIDQGHVVSG
jgi:hypothetical protein